MKRLLFYDTIVLVMIQIILFRHQKDPALAAPITIGALSLLVIVLLDIISVHTGEGMIGKLEDIAKTLQGTNFEDAWPRQIRRFLTVLFCCAGTVMSITFAVMHLWTHAMVTIGSLIAFFCLLL